MITGIYIATVGLERNRWSSKEPSFKVSDWLQRFKADGLDGVELWENHYLLADREEQQRLEAAENIPLFNTYAGFTDADAEQREKASRAIEALGVKGVKYNLGHDQERVAEYRRNLLAWAETLPADCRLLCECHGGTVLEQLDATLSFFADLDPVRFGVMTHLSPNYEVTAPWIEKHGERLQHLHIQMRTPELDPTIAENRAAMDGGFEGVRESGFTGTAALEFTRGIGKEEDIETLYQNTCVDLAYCREALLGEKG